MRGGTAAAAATVYYSPLGSSCCILGNLSTSQSNVCCLLAVDESGPDDGAAKANPSLTREKDLVVNISDLDNIFDEDEEELGVSYSA